ncbi:MAG TPA: terminase large subunit [Solirubrobacteraceae bacterium]|jgi:phage terminase large subunit-like protein
MTVDHWRQYAKLLRLDNGEYWVPEGFQNEFVADLFAGVPEIWLIVPEGNGKTTLLSGVALYHGDYTEDAAVLMAASSRDQCGLLLGQAIGFVERSPRFEKRFRTFEGYRRIDCLRTRGRIQVFAADDRTGDGVIPTLALLDELHRHRSLRLYRTWRGKLDKRDGQLAAISTAGEPGSEFEVTRERARTEAPDISVDGRHVRAASPEMILHDFALRVDDDPEDLGLVASANPFSGVTSASLGRKRASPSMTGGHWRRFVCNLATRTEGAAVGEAEWLAAEAHEEILPGRPCDVGLDLGWKWDATALVPLFSAEWGWLFGKSRVITPPRDGNSLRPERIMDEFEALHAETPIQRVVMDPSAGGEQISGWLEQELGVQVVSHSQKTAPMAVAAGRFMETLRDGTQKHVQDADFTRHVLNAVAYELPDGTFKFVRPVSSRTSQDEAPRREIDALIAGSMVLSTAIGARAYDGPLMELI